MNAPVNTSWHFYLMILASFFIFIIVLRVVLSKTHFIKKKTLIIQLSVLIVAGGMLFGKFGALWGMPWWVYYPVPMLANVFLPPWLLHMNKRQVLLYLLLSFLSAPFIHLSFSFLLGWQEYMPFWDVPYWRNLL